MPVALKHCSHPSSQPIPPSTQLPRCPPPHADHLECRHGGKEGSPSVLSAAANHRHLACLALVLFSCRSDHEGKCSRAAVAFQGQQGKTKTCCMDRQCPRERGRRRHSQHCCTRIQNLRARSGTSRPTACSSSCWLGTAISAAAPAAAAPAAAAAAALNRRLGECCTFARWSVVAGSDVNGLLIPHCRSGTWAEALVTTLRQAPQCRRSADRIDRCFRAVWMRRMWRHVSRRPGIPSQVAPCRQARRCRLHPPGWLNIPQLQIFVHTITQKSIATKMQDIPVCTNGAGTAACLGGNLAIMPFASSGEFLHSH